MKIPKFPYEISWPLGLKSFPVLGSFDMFPFDDFSSTISGADILLSPICKRIIVSCAKSYQSNLCFPFQWIWDWFRIGIRLINELTSQILLSSFFPSIDIFFYHCRQFGVPLYLVVLINFLQPIFLVKYFALFSMVYICEKYLNMRACYGLGLQRSFVYCCSM